MLRSRSARKDSISRIAIIFTTGLFFFPPRSCWVLTLPAPSLPSSTATPSKSCTTHTLNVFASAGSTAREGPSLRPEGQTSCFGLSLWQRSRAPNLREGQVRAHPCRCAPARWYQRQSRTRQRWLVLVVSEVCPGDLELERLEKEA